jgi:serine/threonine protein kinase
VAGTPAYMSPEQAAAKLNQIDTRTDLYSLGVILYRLLTNEFPHELSGTRLEVLRRIAEEEVRRPRQVTKAMDKEAGDLPGRDGPRLQPRFAMLVGYRPGILGDWACGG